MKIVKTYYSNFKNGTATCNLCLKVIKTSGNTTNMASHMKNKHYDVFAKCNQNNVSNNSGENQTVQQSFRNRDCSPDPGIYASKPYFESVMLLKDDMKPKQSLGNLDTSRSNKRLSVAEFEDSVDSVLPQSLDEQCNEEDAFTERKKKTTKTDDDLSFFESLLPYMKRMDMKKKLLCRMEIQKVVLSHFGEK
ncbi:PREDICTED: uncharacterized protein LOC108612537 [Drosophila arizonae]|uniref:Uncharacterized protein LOC108612537 n=1 Tax=Drosophila arizonae TaxID=7263 RepID=A0ABM1P157_DROAR|nr:PREDICTED: uncharacterized protein LOC108612537 [Drosophila arizonae]